MPIFPLVLGCSTRIRIYYYGFGKLTSKNQAEPVKVGYKVEKPELNLTGLKNCWNRATFVTRKKKETEPHWYNFRFRWLHKTNHCTQPNSCIYLKQKVKLTMDQWVSVGIIALTGNRKTRWLHHPTVTNKNNCLPDAPATCIDRTEVSPRFNLLLYKWLYFLFP